MLDLIQIGAHIGDDHVSSLINKDVVKKCLLFEPIKELFKCCEWFYKDNPNVEVIEKAVVCDNSSSCTMFLPRPEVDVCWSNQLGSMFEDHASKHGMEGTVKYKADAIDATLLPDAKYLYVDAEGYDFDILQRYLSARKRRPLEIFFEHIHLREKNYARLLFDLGYQVEEIDPMNSHGLFRGNNTSIFT